MSFSKHYNDMYKNEKMKKFNITTCQSWPTNRFEFAICNASGGKTVCDVGCGDGSILYSLKEKYSQFIGFDVSDKRLEIAMQYCKDLNAQFHNVRFDEEIDPNMKSVDTIICLDVLDHMIDVRKALQNFYNLLNKDGQLILSVPNVARIDQRIRLLFGKFPSTATQNQGIDKEGDCELIDGGKCNYFTFSSITALLQEVGFSKIEKFGIGKYKKIHNLYPELLSGSISLVCSK
jgi:ubiquinone/menaquinone biosynthesis C-methylase UbiE